MPTPLERLRHHVSGAIERGEATPIAAIETPFVTLIADRAADYDGAPEGARYPLLHVTFQEESYDATCIAVQTLVDALPGMFAGDELRVQFIHARPHLSATWQGVMPSRAAAPSDADWREFLNAVHGGTRP